MENVHLDYDKYAEKSPFELSGGQMRRVAIAGVLAMEPSVLILDEPTAGLDPRGRDRILSMLEELRARDHTTVLMVSHSMEDMARLADRLLVMSDGRLAADGTPGRSVRPARADAFRGAGCSRGRPALRPAAGKRPGPARRAVPDEGCPGSSASPLEGGGRMLKNITMGQYYPVDSPVHRLDPRVKLILTLVFIIVVFLVKTLAGYALLLVFLYGVARCARVPFKMLLKGLRPLRMILVLTFLLNLFFTPGENVLLSFWVIRITSEALQQAVFYSLRLVFLVMGTSLLTLTTSPVALSDALEMLLSPLKKIHFPPMSWP